ncbi:MAG: bifunctional heptose 7-phosphate kinase/heptose 1-phosphate adenyltransferase [Gammaproteobacteria bacterium]|nr:MAG: bifunctional heptose 7-phosphate kinase/heptose 1-phosphate adenyltransferase [Gammaproteobacteria bacterium]
MKISFPDFSQAKVLVVGDIMLDRYWHGPTSRISPEAPVPVVKVDQTEDRPGGAGNVALNISHLGGKVDLFGLTGNDEAADTLETRLNGIDVNCFFKRLDNVPTITKLRIISRHQQLLRLDFENTLEEYQHHDLATSIAERINQANVVLLSDYAKGVLCDPQPLITMAKSLSIPVLVDPKGSDFERYRGATLLTPNLSEFEAVVGPCADENTLVERGLELLEDLQLEALLVTRGEQGMTLLQAGHSVDHFPAKAKEVFDVTGAGDTVIATLAAGLAAGCDLISATGLANLAGGIVVGKLGTAAISTVELRRALLGDSETGLGVVSEEQLMLAITDARAHGEKVVMTNGCFDILHSGHVSYLHEAKQLGHRLIVAVNDDSSVTRLKGPGRPVNPVERRMSVLAGLGAVDWVVPFSEDTPERLICKLLPDVLVKGGDYKVEDIAGGTCVQSNGGEVKILSFEDGISTSQIIKALKADDQQGEA